MECNEIIHESISPGQSLSKGKTIFALQMGENCTFLWELEHEQTAALYTL